MLSTFNFIKCEGNSGSIASMHFMSFLSQARGYKCFIVRVICFYGIVVSPSLLFAEYNEVCLFWFISESFVLCKTYCPPLQYVPNIDKSVLCLAELSDSHQPRFPFKACGNQISYDSDTTYPLQVCSNWCYNKHRSYHCTIVTLPIDGNDRNSYFKITKAWVSNFGKFFKQIGISVSIMTMLWAGW
jgi:hypothetical protein